MLDPRAPTTSLFDTLICWKWMESQGPCKTLRQTLEEQADTHNAEMAITRRFRTGG